MSAARKNPNAVIAEAVSLHRTGRLEQALALYQHVLVQEPAHADGLHLSGLVFHGANRTVIAAALIRRALAVSPAHDTYLLNLATVLAGRPEERAAWKAAIAASPANQTAYSALGYAWHRAGRPGDMAAAMAAAARLDPVNASLQGDFGGALMMAARRDDAATALIRAICLDPSRVQPYSNLGIIHKDRQNPQGAAKAYSLALRLQPDFAEAHSNLGFSLLTLAKPRESAEACRRAIVSHPGFAAAYCNLGNALLTLHPARSAAASRTACILDPRHAEARNNLGIALKDLGRITEARAAYTGALVLKPDYAEAFNNLGNLYKDQAHHKKSVAAYRAALRVRPSFPDAHSNLICGLHYHSGSDRASLFREASLFAVQLPSKQRIPRDISQEADRRPLRIGYVSGDLHTHPVGFFLLPVLANHSARAVETFCYSNRLLADDMTGQLRRHANHWRIIAGLPDNEAADVIRADAIDILIDLSGHTAYNRLPLFALRPAPIQASWLGYWNTTGLPQIDYLVTDETTVPEQEERWYSETVRRLPATRFCYDPPVYAPEPAIIEDRPITFGSFNNLAKIASGSLDLWSRLLHAAPEARLLMKWKTLADANVRAQLLAAFEARGIPQARLVLRSASPHADMLREYGEIDVALDPFPFSGGLTSCEALWMGVPVMTLPGEAPQSRQTAAFLKAIGHPEWIATSPDDFIARTVALAAAGTRATGPRRELRARMAASPLCDGPALARNLEALYLSMVKDASA